MNRATGIGPPLARGRHEPSSQTRLPSLAKIPERQRGRGLVILVLMIGGWLGWIVRGARIQREAVAAVRRTGGSVLYDWQIRGDHGAVGGEPGAPAWLVELIGVEYFGDITEVRLGVSGTDTALEPVAQLEGVQWLRLDRTAVTDLGLAHLRRMSSLSRLDLWDTRVTDAGIVQLKGLTRLKQLGLSGTSVTDAGVRDLRQASRRECRSAVDLIPVQSASIRPRWIARVGMSNRSNHPQVASWRIY